MGTFCNAYHGSFGVRKTGPRRPSCSKPLLLTLIGSTPDARSERIDLVDVLEKFIIDGSKHLTKSSRQINKPEDTNLVEPWAVWGRESNRLLT